MNALRTALLPSLAFAALLLLRAGAAPAQGQCRSDIHTDGRDPYRYLHRGDRCEGSCGRRMSNNSWLRIVGFSRGAVFPASGMPTRLELQWTSPASGAVELQVSAVSGPFCYRMDTTRPPLARQFGWSTRVVREIGVQPAHLAALVWSPVPVGEARQPVLVPVEPTAGAGDHVPFVVQVVPARDFREIRFSLRPAAGGADIVAERSLGRAFYPDDVVVPVVLPPGLPAGVPLRLRIDGYYTGGSHSTEEILWIPR